MTPHTSVAAARLPDLPANTGDVAIPAPQPAAVPGASEPEAVFKAAQHLLPHLEQGQRINAAMLRAAMHEAFDASDSAGAWDWKLAYGATEVATVLFLRRFGSASIMLDDGGIEARVRLIRPMEGLPHPLASMAETLWRQADQESFAAAWERELAELPEFTDSTIHMVTGLLLPIWTRLPHETARVYRLETDTGERIIGRRVPPAWAAAAVATDRPALSPEDAFAVLNEGRTALDLEGGMQLRAARVMHAQRIELAGFGDADRERLKADGLFSEIIAWELRLFVPTDISGPAVLGRVLTRHPLTRIRDREAVS